jgi:hypothetical protein
VERTDQRLSADALKETQRGGELAEVSMLESLRERDVITEEDLVKAGCGLPARRTAT